MPGPIIFQTPEKIGPSETATELSTRLSEVGAEALVEALALLGEGAARRWSRTIPKRPTLPRWIGRWPGWIGTGRPRNWAGISGGWMRSRAPGPPWARSAVKLSRPRPEPRFSHGAPPGTVLEADPEGASWWLAVRGLFGSGRSRARGRRGWR